jgi:hypothetical protein
LKRERKREREKRLDQKAIFNFFRGADPSGGVLKSTGIPSGHHLSPNYNTNKVGMVNKVFIQIQDAK